MLPVRYRRADGRARLSVTQILTLAGRIETQWFTPEATARGTLVHALTEAIDRGESPIIPAPVAGYVDAYRAFLAGVRPVWVGIETEVHSDVWDLAGRIDRVAASLFGSPALLDIKTGVAQPWHDAQLAAYNVLRPTGARWTLYLKPTGRFRLQQYDTADGFRRFYFDWATVRGTVTADGDHWCPVSR